MSYKETKERVANAFRAMKAIGISEDKVKPALKNLLKLYDKNWALIEEDNYRALADAVMSNTDVKAKDAKTRIANAFHAMKAIGISEDKVKPALKNLLKLYDKNWALIEEDNYRALADAVMSNTDVKAKDAKTRIANAFHAMKAIGISEDKVKPVLKNLLKLYDKNWDLIEEENYRALADAIFESEKAEEQERLKKTVNSEVAGHSKKTVNSEKENHLDEETQAAEDTERPLKRLRLKYRNGQTSSSSPSNSRAPKTPLAKPKEEPNELPENSPPKLNALQGTVESPQPNTKNTRVVNSEGVPSKSKGKQPVSPNSLVAHGVNTPLVNESGSPSSMRLADRGKGSLSPQIPFLEKKSVPNSSSRALCLKEPQKGPLTQALIVPKDEPITDDIPCLEAPLAVVHPGKAEMEARLDKLLSKKTKKSVAARASAGTGSSSGVPRPTAGERGPVPSARGSGSSSSARVVPNPAPLRQVEPTIPEGPNSQDVPTIHVSDESPEPKLAPFIRRKRSRHESRNLMGVQPQTEGSSRSPVPSIDIVHQYEAYLLRDRMQQQGEEWRPQLLPDQPAIVPDWRVYPMSSVLGTDGAKVASEMARNCMLPTDMAQLVTMPHTRLEDMLHKALNEASLVAHSLSLNISHMKHENTETRKAYENAAAEIEEARKLQAEAEAQAMVQSAEQVSRQMAD